MNVSHIAKIYKKLGQYFEETTDSNVHLSLKRHLFSKKHILIDTKLLTRLANSKNAVEQKYYKQLAYNAVILSKRYLTTTEP